MGEEKMEHSSEPTNDVENPDVRKVSEPKPTSGELREERAECYGVVGVSEFVKKLKGNPGVEIGESALYDRMVDGCLSALGSMIGLMAVAALNWEVDGAKGWFFLASFGASSVLIYAAPNACLSQPWNFVVGHLIAAVTGITVRIIFNHDPDLFWISVPLSCSATIFIQHLFRAQHPPGGATSIIANIANAPTVSSRWNGYFFAISPVGSGVLVLLFVGLIVNNIPRRRRYPEYWSYDKRMRW